MRINPAYCKQITVVNHSNPANHGYVTLKSNNEDSNRVSLHALFYLVRTRYPALLRCFVPRYGTITVTCWITCVLQR